MEASDAERDACGGSRQPGSGAQCVRPPFYRASYCWPHFKLSPFTQQTNKTHQFEGSELPGFPKEWARIVNPILATVRVHWGVPIREMKGFGDFICVCDLWQCGALVQLGLA